MSFEFDCFSQTKRKKKIQKQNKKDGEEGLI